MSKVGKENGVIQGLERGVTHSSLPASQGTESKLLPSVSSSFSGVATVSSKVTPRRVPKVPMRRGANNTKKHAVSDANELGSALLPPPPHVTAKTPPFKVKTGHEQPTPSFDHVASHVSVLGVYSSASDPILVPSLDSRLPGYMAAKKLEVNFGQGSMNETQTMQTVLF
ncbi:hypothetical protein IFM89_018480 [Coptis chinensis]|uniref:Uncharacterized protein n=1 Tax=Coptis chinensis TaxID=261450 RepID=A0A835M6A8_9MAGN|nr:hypothetical protein IFM89_018480 [Coptis chinensis]